MKIDLPKDKDLTDIETACCWITIGNYVYYFDDSTSELVVQRWRGDIPIRGREVENIQIEETE